MSGGVVCLYALKVKNNGGDAGRNRNGGDEERGVDVCVYVWCGEKHERIDDGRAKPQSLKVQSFDVPI